MLVREIEALRHAVRVTRLKRPFRIDAWVVLPDHMHCVWTLPEGDADFGGRMGQIKATFSKALPEGRLRSSHILRREGLAVFVVASRCRCSSVGCATAHLTPESEETRPSPMNELHPV